jgi:hypothetical protein
MLQRRIELTDTIFVTLFLKLGVCTHFYPQPWMESKTLIDPERPAQKRRLWLIKLFPKN